MNRTESRENWRRLAEGDADEELMAWLRIRASAILAADDNPDANARRGDLVRALGLAGREESVTKSELEMIRTITDFGVSDGQGGELPRKRGDDWRDMVGLARAYWPGWHSLSDDEVRKRLDRLFRKL